jgi:hypothetical protein
MGWILEHAAKDKSKAAIICQKMLERNLFELVDQQQGGMYNRKKFNVNNLYRFYMDRNDIADN